MTDSKTDSFMRYKIYLAKEGEALEQHNSSGLNLEMAHIRRRLAEAKSQHQPVGDVEESNLTGREKMCAIAHWVVIGCLPILEREAGDG